MRVVILLTGRAGSKSVVGKNIYPVLGKPLAWYAMYAAKQSKLASEIWVTSDCPEIQRVATNEGIFVIDRPKSLAKDDSELPDAIEHALDTIGRNLDVLVTMHCNCCVHRPGLVDDCIEHLLGNPEADSCVTGYVDNSVHPYRTKRISKEGLLQPWLDVPEGTSNNRQALEQCFILDGAVRALRFSECFPAKGQKPFTYLGNSILPMINHSVGDVHSLLDIKISELALTEMGWSSAK